MREPLEEEKSEKKRAKAQREEKDARRRRIWRVVILGIRAAVSGVWVWVRHNRLRDVGGIFRRNNNVLSGGDSIDRIRGVELSKGKGSALKPGSKGAKPP